MYYPQLNWFFLFSSLFYSCCCISYDPTTLALENQFPLAIYHAFDENFVDVQAKLYDLYMAGFSHIQLSPVQEIDLEIPSENDKWWKAYQPISYNIGGKYGTREELQHLIMAAKALGIGIIVDVVLNHLGPVYKYSEVVYNKATNSYTEPRPRSSNSWHSADKKNIALLNAYLDQVIQKYKHLGLKTRYHFRPPSQWGFSAFSTRHLPSLNLDNKDVQSIHLGFLISLLDLEVAGFRFDAIGTFTPQYLNFLNSEITTRTRDRAFFFYGEFSSGDPRKYENFIYFAKNPRGLHTMDFVLYYELARSFLYGQSLARLQLPCLNNDPWAITFADNHDTWAHRVNGEKGYAGWGDDDGDEIDRILAIAYLLTRKGGVPLILNKNYEADARGIIRTALQFRQNMRIKSAPIEYVNVINDNAVKIDRGNVGFAIINKAGEDIHFFVPNGYSKLLPDGTLDELSTGDYIISGRSAEFFVRSAA